MPVEGPAGVTRRTAGRRRSEGWLLGRLAGVPVVLARSWLIIAVVITVLFARTVRGAAPDLGAVAAHAVALGYAVLLLASVLVHELAHAVTARALGMTPTRIVLTLWGGHTSFEADARSPRASFLVAVAGPASNAVLAALAWAALGQVPLTPVTQLLLIALALANAFVAVTNVLPGLPLDGGRMLEAVVWRVRGDRDEATVVAGWGGRVVAVGLPLLVALSWVSDGAGGAPSPLTLGWAALVGALLWSAAGAELQGARIRRRAPGAAVAALARPAVAVDAAAPLGVALAARGSVGADGRGWVVLTDPAGAPTGVLDPRAAHLVPAARRAVVPASSAEVALAPGAVVAWDLGGQELLRMLPGLPREPWVVLDDSGAVRGVLLSRDVIAAVTGRRPAGRGAGET